MSTYVILDTCIVSYIMKHDSRGKDYLAQLHSYQASISFMTLAEICRWPRQRQWGDARSAQFFEHMKQYPVLPFTENVCWYWALVKDYDRSKRMNDGDAWIAATALAYKAPLATHNFEDFRHIVELDIIHVPGVN